ncbi:hypothetical protein AURDEDRAFT_128574 [Auricularia subglabra TFB-10046 SS5]|nr:hypothetical protein AURDEDRAFT_128574 [Auricularia subglabra TFB-10046 SS5]
MLCSVLGSIDFEFEDRLHDLPYIQELAAMTRAFFEHYGGTPRRQVSWPVTPALSQQIQTFTDAQGVLSGGRLRNLVLGLLEISICGVEHHVRRLAALDSAEAASCGSTSGYTHGSTTPETRRALPTSGQPRGGPPIHSEGTKTSANGDDNAPAPRLALQTGSASCSDPHMTEPGDSDPEPAIPLLAAQLASVPAEARPDFPVLSLGAPLEPQRDRQSDDKPSHETGVGEVGVIQIVVVARDGPHTPTPPSAGAAGPGICGGDYAPPWTYEDPPSGVSTEGGGHEGRAVASPAPPHDEAELNA